MLMALPSTAAAQCVTAREAINIPVATLVQRGGCDGFVEIYIMSFDAGYWMDHALVGPETNALSLAMVAFSTLEMWRDLSREMDREFSEDLEIEMLYYAMLETMEGDVYPEEVRQIIASTFVALVTGSNDMGMRQFPSLLPHEGYAGIAYDDLNLVRRQDQGLCFWRHYLPGLAVGEVLVSESYKPCVEDGVFLRD